MTFDYAVGGLHRAGTKFMCHTILSEDPNAKVLHFNNFRWKLERLKKQNPNMKVYWMVRQHEEHSASLLRLANTMGLNVFAREHEEVKKLCEEYKIDFEGNNLFDKMISSNLALAKYWKEKGIVDEIIEMESLKDKPHFKKNNEKLRLIIPHSDRLKKLDGYYQDHQSN